MVTGNRVDYLKAKIDRSREELKDFATQYLS